MLLRVVAAVLATLVAAAGLAGCDGEKQPDAPAPSAGSPALADFPTRDLAVTRADFCARVAPTAVADALGGEAESSRSYGNGDRAQVASGVRDVAHEYGCSWRAADGTLARAWVFAPPVTLAQARALRAAMTGQGCRAVEDAPAYGRSSVAVRCGVESAYHGLFGDAWLSCSLAVPGNGARDGLLERTGRWCVTVAQAAAA